MWALAAGRGQGRGRSGGGRAGAAALTSALVFLTRPHPAASAASAAAPGGGRARAAPRALRQVRRRGSVRSRGGCSTPRPRPPPPPPSALRRLQPSGWARRPLPAASGNPTAASPRTPRARTARPRHRRARSLALPPCAGSAREPLKGAAPRHRGPVPGPGLPVSCAELRAPGAGLGLALAWACPLPIGSVLSQADVGGGLRAGARTRPAPLWHPEPAPRTHIPHPASALCTPHLAPSPSTQPRPR